MKTLRQLLADAALVRVSQVRRLFTREDARIFHAHKLLGVPVLAHFAYRVLRWLKEGDTGLASDVASFPWTMLCVYAAHAALHVTSFAFHVPDRRNTRYNVIWTEMRWHTLLFAYRSLAILGWHWLQVNGGELSEPATALSGTFRSICVLLTMLGADRTTSFFRERRNSAVAQAGGEPAPAEPDTSRTMRSNPYPAYLPASCVRVHNLFYSFSQVLATLVCLASPSPSRVFFTLLPIQLAPFLMTLQKKGIITQAAWHFWYTAALLLNFVFRPSAADFRGPETPPSTRHFSGVNMWLLGVAFCVARFGLRIDKYKLWVPIATVTAVITLPEK